MSNDRMTFKLNKQVDPKMSSQNRVFLIDDQWRETAKSVFVYQTCELDKRTVDELSEDKITVNQMSNHRMAFKLNNQVDPEMSSFNQVFSIDDQWHETAKSVFVYSSSCPIHMSVKQTVSR